MTLFSSSGDRSGEASDFALKPGSSSPRYESPTRFPIVSVFLARIVSVGSPEQRCYRPLRIRKCELRGIHGFGPLRLKSVRGLTDDFPEAEVRITYESHEQTHSTRTD